MCQFVPTVLCCIIAATTIKQLIKSQRKCLNRLLFCDSSELMSVGLLRIGEIDLNNLAITKEIIETISQLIQISSSYYTLRFKSPYYFETPEKQLPAEKGWYIIMDSNNPLYVGKADNLNLRLNSNSGSIDNFANSKRVFDPERNFVKRLSELGIIRNLKVCIILEKDLCSKLSTNQTNLTELDRGNIEKVINIFRTYFHYL